MGDKKRDRRMSPSDMLNLMRLRGELPGEMGVDGGDCLDENDTKELEEDDDFSEDDVKSRAEDELEPDAVDELLEADTDEEMNGPEGGNSIRG